MTLFDRTGEIPVRARIVAVLWLSFLTAAAATGVFFSAIDPLELRYCVEFPELGRLGAYTVGFLLFWLLTASTSLLAVFFTHPSRAADDSPRTPEN
jgi:hypothetical protein